jgi:predicted enzyme related to lactoylglutathione lyase
MAGSEGTGGGGAAAGREGLAQGRAARAYNRAGGTTSRAAKKNKKQNGARSVGRLGRDGGGINVAGLLVNIDVPDINSAIRFYTGGLGLVFERFLTEQVAELSLDGTKFYLLEKKSGSRAAITSSDERVYERHWTPVHLDFVVENIAEAFEKALAAGAKVDTAIATHAWGKIAILSDPFGNGFCLIEFIGRGYDELVAP